MRAVSYKVTEPPTDRWQTVESIRFLWKRFKCQAFKTAQGFTNRLAKDGEYKGPFLHTESDKTMQLEVRFAEGSENCSTRRWRRGPGVRSKKSVSEILPVPAPSAEPPAPGLDRFAVIEKEPLNPDICEKFQSQSQYACAGYAHSYWATQG